MGDLVEITTVPNQEEISYKISSGSFRFQVKGLQSAGIGLSISPDSRYSSTIWLILAKDGSPTVTVAKDGSECLISTAHNLLSTQEFRDFWIQWHNGVISLGRDFNEDPLIVYKRDTFGRIYITFVVYGNSNSNRTLQWRFEMPPTIIQEQMKLRPVDDGIPTWVQFQAPPLRERKRFRPVSGDGFPKWVAACIQFPEGALIGGYQEEVLYVIRAKHEGSLTPGKFIPSQGLGYIPWGGEMHEKTEVEFLCGYDFLWVPSSDGKVPAGAVEAGYSEVNHETLYIGRARYDYYNIIPGKVQPSHHCCYIPYDNVEIPTKNYEILVIPKKM